MWIQMIRYYVMIPASWCRCRASRCRRSGSPCRRCPTWGRACRSSALSSCGWWWCELFCPQTPLFVEFKTKRVNVSPLTWCANFCPFWSCRSRWARRSGSWGRQSPSRAWFLDTTWYCLDLDTTCYYLSRSRHKDTTCYYLDLDS